MALNHIAAAWASLRYGFLPWLEPAAGNTPLWWVRHGSPKRTHFSVKRAGTKAADAATGERLFPTYVGNDDGDITEAPACHTWLGKIKSYLGTSTCTAHLFARGRKGQYFSASDYICTEFNIKYGP